VRLVIDIAIAIAIATVIGFSTAWIAVTHGYLFGAIHAGGWTAWPSAGSADADPYSLATLARDGEVPLGEGEGIAFTADTDTDGAPLSGTCSYELAGQTPAARLWTLTAYDADGRLMLNAPRRQGFHSREIVRRTDGSFAIEISSQVKPGNWLPVAPVSRIKLVLRLYDTPLTTGSRIADLAMPAIRKVSCP
jgi:hypothetical protein